MAYISFKPKDYFNTLLYDGNGSTNARTGLGFEPDWIWIKNNTGDHDHYLFDQVRGTTKYVRSNQTNAEGTASGVTSFDSDGFTLGNSDGMNENGRNFVAWNWRASGSQGSSNTDGSINTTYTSVNTTSGFSICQYTGTGSAATVGHGLGAVPKIILVKKTSGSESWGVYHHSIGNTKFLQLNTTGVEGTSSGFWNNTTPTSSVFSIKSDGGTNASGQTYIAYCFAEKTGFSKFRKYIGNGSSNGPFIYTGFKPAWVMIKKATGSTNAWLMIDNKRPIYNGNTARLEADTQNAESSSTGEYAVDLLSNGFKFKGSGGGLNNNNSTYIYMAFAEEPFVASNGTPATAR